MLRVCLGAVLYPEHFIFYRGADSTPKSAGPASIYKVSADVRHHFIRTMLFPSSFDLNPRSIFRIRLATVPESQYDSLDTKFKLVGQFEGLSQHLERSYRCLSLIANNITS